MERSGRAHAIARSAVASCKGIVKGGIAAALCAVMAASGASARALRRIRRPRARPFPGISPGAGVSIVIPERDNRGLLEDCLRSVQAAAAEIDEPSEVVVVVNGCRAQDYARLRRDHGAVAWLFVDRPLGFGEAVRRGLRAARFEWVYLLNNDMVLDRHALREVLRWRAARVFAVASQIFMKDTRRRREETGWGAFSLDDGAVEIFDAVPEDDETARGALYAGGGCSLFQRRVLQRLIPRRDPYFPFYWEDVEWGAEAWKRGYEVLFCPASKALHSHRATIRKFYTREEVEATFNRNACQFHLRNIIYVGNARALRRRLLGLHGRHFLRVACPPNVLRAVIRHLGSVFLPFDDRCLEFVLSKYYHVPACDAPARPSVLLVSPYALFPPAHGGAVRVYSLLRHLSRSFSIVILSDELEAYSRDSRPYFRLAASVHLVGGRKQAAGGDCSGQMARIRSHSRPAMKRALDRLISCCRPSIVQIEYLELAALAAGKRDATPWVLTLHDALLSSRADRITAENRRRLALISRFDAVIACSPEDRRLLPEDKAWLVPNGAAVEEWEYTPSPPSMTVLAVGAFRYRQHLQGLREFVERVYPALREALPEVKLWLLGGHGAVEAAHDMAWLREPGVTVFDYVPDTRPYLGRAAVTINPLCGIRGSSIKLIESLAAGRVCVSTVDGARGFTDQGFRSLVTVPRIDDFLQPLCRLLSDPGYRHSIERLPAEVLEPHSWRRAGEKLEELYRTLLGRPGMEGQSDAT